MASLAVCRSSSVVDRPTTATLPLFLSFDSDDAMSTDLFRFRHRPYAAAADTANYVPFESIESALDAVTGGIRREAGPALVIGASGLGKTMFCRVLAERLAPSHEVVLLATSRLCTRRALLQNMLFELDLPYRDREEGELRLGLLDHLRSRHSAAGGMLLLIDEAHTMPLRLLEEVRGLTNIVRDGRPRVHLVLIGNQTLDERLNHPKLDAIHQRIATRCYLYPMTREETSRFVARQWSAAVAEPVGFPFDEAALRRIHQAADGIPRLANQLCDQALLLANARRLTHLDDNLIQEAWSDLQQMPTPWQVNHRETTESGRPASTVIEFGTLGDDFGGPGTSSFESEAIDRIETLEAWTSEVIDLDEPEAASSPVVAAAAPAEPIEPTTIDPFAAERFDDEEWIVLPIGGSRTHHGFSPRSEQGEPNSNGESSASGAPSPIAEISIDFGGLHPIAETDEPFESPIDLSGVDDSGSEADAEYSLEALDRVDDPFADGAEYDDEPIAASESRRSPFEYQAPSDVMRLKGFDPSRPSTLQSDDEGDAPALLPRIRQGLPVSAMPESVPQSEPERPSRTSKPSGNFHHHQDDKDLIVIEDPLPRNALRIITASPVEPGRSNPGPPSPAYREDYHSLFTRLRGTSDR